MTIVQRLRELDRAAGLGRNPTQEQWRRAARRWRWPLAIAVSLMLSVVAAGVLAPSASPTTFFTGCLAVWLAFLAGRWKAEDDRLNGRDNGIAGQRRPPAL